MTNSPLSCLMRPASSGLAIGGFHQWKETIHLASQHHPTEGWKHPSLSKQTLKGVLCQIWKLSKLGHHTAFSPLVGWSEVCPAIRTIYVPVYSNGNLQTKNSWYALKHIAVRACGVKRGTPLPSLQIRKFCFSPQNGAVSVSKIPYHFFGLTSLSN